MLYPGKGAAHFPDGLHRDTAPDRSGSSQQIFDVVQTPQLHILLRQERGHLAILCHAEHPVFPQESAVIGLTQAGKPDLFSLAVCLHRPGDGVLVPQHSPAGRLLIQQDVALCVDILLHILMVIQVVGGHIGHHRHLGALAHTDELEAGQLHHRHILRGDLGQHGQQRRTDIAAQVDPAARRLKEFGDQGRRGGLAVRAGHRHDLTGAQIKEQLYLTGHLGPSGNGILQGLLVIFKARRAQDHILSGKTVHIMFAQAETHPQTAQGLSIGTKLLQTVLTVAQGHLRTQAHKLLDQGAVADPRPDECHLFALHHLGKALLLFLHKSSSSLHRLALSPSVSKGAAPPMGCAGSYALPSYYRPFLPPWQGTQRLLRQGIFQFLNKPPQSSTFAVL